MGLGDLPAGAPAADVGRRHRYDGLWDDLPHDRMTEGVALLVAHFGPDDARRFIDTMTRARMRQLALNGTDSAYQLAQEYVPHAIEAARTIKTWAKSNPVVVGGAVGSVLSALFSYHTHRKRDGV